MYSPQMGQGRAFRGVIVPDTNDGTPPGGAHVVRVRQKGKFFYVDVLFQDIDPWTGKLFSGRRLFLYAAEAEEDGSCVLDQYSDNPKGLAMLPAGAGAWERHVFELSDSMAEALPGRSQTYVIPQLYGVALTKLRAFLADD